MIKSKDSIEIRSFAFLLAMLTICNFALYFNFIFGDKLFIFAGVGSDSIGQTIPFMLNEASRLYSGDISQWNQYQFLGAPTIQFLNLEYIPSLFGRDAIPTLMLCMQLAKIYLTGIFFYFFLGYHNLTHSTRIIASCCLAFCGRMIELAPWTAYTIEIPFATGMLWGFERFLSDHRKILVLPAMIACIGLTQGLYALVLYTLVLIMYAIFRIGYLWNSQWNRRRVVSTSLKLLALVLIGYGIASPIIYPSIKMYATSARVSSDIPGSFSLLQLLAPTDLKLFAEEIVKLFSNGILGHMESYRGYSNILNAPYFYCGILAVITIPFAFKDKTKRQRGFLLFIAISAIFYMYSQGFRYLINGFSVPGDDFRQSSFWIVLVIGLLGAYGLDNAITSKANKPKLQILSSIVFSTLLVAASIVLVEQISYLYLILSLALILLYTILLQILQSANRNKTKTIAITIMLAVMPLELIAQNLMPIRNSTYISEYQYAAHFSNNPSSAIESVSDLKRNTYRIDYKAIDLTNPMANAYMGTQAYIGGAGISTEVNEFLKNTPNSNARDMGYTRYIYGFNDIAINSLLGVKYLIAPNDAIKTAVPFGYHQIKQYDSYAVLENSYALPLIFGYGNSEVKSHDELSALTYQAKIPSLISEAVIGDIDSSSDLTEANTSSQSDDQAYSYSAITESVTINKGCLFDIPESQFQYLQLNMFLHDIATPSGMLVIYFDFYNEQGSIVARYPYITANGNERITIPFINEGYKKVGINIASTNACNDPYIDNISYSFTSNSDYSSFIAAYNQRMKNASTVTKYENGQLSATIDMKEAGYLATSIPWDPSWKLFIDGRETQTQVINMSFVGAEISEGKHDILLKYDDRPLYACVITSSALSLICIIIEASSNRRRKSDKLIMPS